jgi:lipoprotein-anchoring transpeptidase ErfK/SrfK
MAGLGGGTRALALEPPPAVVVPGASAVRPAAAGAAAAASQQAVSSPVPAVSRSADPPAPPGAPGVAATSQSAAADASSTRRIVLELGRRTISLLEGERVLGSWPVAVGDPATPTPIGSYAILNKVINPQYQSTRTGKNNPTIGPNGPLGDRWMGFHTTANNQYGIHGTPPAWEWSVNTRAAVSHGCVRMLTPNVRFLFDRVSVGTPVIVKP